MTEQVSVFRRFGRERRGVAAVEFAILAPVLLCCYLVSMEMSQAVEVSKKASRVGSMVADLITQQPEVTASQVKAVMEIGEALVQPYNRSNPTITVTAIQMSDDPAPKATVAWSSRLVDKALTKTAPFGKGSPVAVPAKLLTRNGFLIRVESSLAYKPMTTWSAAHQEHLGILEKAIPNVTMGDTYFLRPRQSDSIPCKDC